MPAPPTRPPPTSSSPRRQWSCPTSASPTSTASSTAPSATSLGPRVRRSGCAGPALARARGSPDERSGSASRPCLQPACRVRFARTEVPPAGRRLIVSPRCRHSRPAIRAGGGIVTHGQGVPASGAPGRGSRRCRTRPSGFGLSAGSRNTPTDPPATPGGNPRGPALPTGRGQRCRSRPAAGGDDARARARRPRGPRGPQRLPVARGDLIRGHRTSTSPTSACRPTAPGSTAVRSAAAC